MGKEDKQDRRHEEHQPHNHREEERGAKPSSSNRLTHAQFLSWKRQKDALAAGRKAEASRKRQEDIASGLVQMNGRELFLHEPWVFDNNLY